MSAYITSVLAQRIGFTGGVVASSLASIQTPVLIETLMYAMLGAVVSFTTSVVCKVLYQVWKKRFLRKRKK